MKNIVSYCVELKQVNKILKPLVEVYQKALTYCIKVVEKEYDYLSEFSKLKQNNIMEKLIHNTKDNQAKYDFDTSFYKMPTYMRRAVVSEALGIVSSYKSNYNNWLENGSIGNEPQLNYKHNSYPTFYKNDMFKEKENYTIRLKLYLDNDYKFVDIKLKKTDKDYILKHFAGCDISSPTLEKRYSKWYLRFAITVESYFKGRNIKNSKICAVDLGINTDATISIMNSKGTVLKRKFVNFKSEKDLRNKLLNRIKRLSKEKKSTSKTWRYVKNINDELAKKIALEICNFANIEDVDVIVFEHLDNIGKVRGKNKQTLHMWNKQLVQKLTISKAHRLGIRVNTVNARNTSKLAFDGSGEVKRDNKNYSICTFKSKKQYNCDLNASYNIGARYYIKELIKTLTEKKRSEVEAKVPLLMKRTTCTLNTLLELNLVM